MTTKYVLPNSDIHIKAFVAEFTEIAVVQICKDGMHDGSFGTVIQLTNRKEALTLAQAIIEAAEILSE